ncbi:SET domain-containing protein [Aureococcus anophagefferens]|nr:SET domain-containing protein [Aureococcus anophagefferens]
MEGAAIVTFEDRSLKVALPKRKPLSAARLWEKCCTHFGIDGDRFELQSDGAPISGDLIESRAMLAIAKPKTRAVAAPPPAPEPAAAPPSSERRVFPFEPAGAGVAIGHDAYFGHILVAARDFAPGDLYLDAFAAAPDASKELILEMWAPPLDGTDASTQTARQLAAELARAPPEFDLGLAHRLVLIHTTNAHETRDAAGGERGALFHVASKVSHSCAPNATFATRGARLNYRCIRPIKAGEQVTFSYVGHDAWRQRREERRATLKQRYFFTCRCDHCAGPDPCRALLAAAAAKYVPLFEIAHGADDAAVKAFAARAAGRRVPPARDVFAPEPRARRCDVCGAAGKLLACSLCKDRQYCSRAHQRLAWPAHKKACRQQPSPA